MVEVEGTLRGCKLCDVLMAAWEVEGAGFLVEKTGLFQLSWGADW
jgi:hypothetical protein